MKGGAKRSIGTGALILLLLSFFNQVAADIPPEDNMELFLELVVNGVSTQHIAVVHYRSHHYYLSLEDLKKTPILLEDLGDFQNGKEIAIDMFDGVKVNYDQSYQRLDITVIPRLLPEQLINPSKREQQKTYSSFGLLLNYDIYVTKPKYGSSSINVWNEFRTFGPWGNFSHTGVYRHSSSDRGGDSSNKYTRYDTRWQYSDEKRMTTMTVGDFITRPLVWSNPARLGGIQFSHNFSLRPDIITYPLPQFSGEADLPSTVELFINSYRYQQQDINAGPYVINDIPFLSGASEGVIVTTDALGRTVSTPISFYVTPNLLRKGLLDYTISFGAIRKKYGIKNFSYGELAMDASLRYGLTNNLTVDLHSELSSSVQVLGAGMTNRIGQLGIITTAFSASNNKGKQGAQLYLGYEYVSRRFNIMAQYTRRNKLYKDLSSIGYTHGNNKETVQLTFSAPIKNYGTVSIGHFASKDHAGFSQKALNLSWNRSFSKFGTVIASANRYSASESRRINSYSQGFTGKNDKKWSFSLQWMIPLDSQLGNISMTADNNANSNNSYLFSYDRSIPNDGGLGWNLSYNRYQGNDDYYNANLKWRNNHMKVEGGIYGTQRNETYWGSMTGSIISMDKVIFAANQVNDSFVVVSTDGIQDIPILYENSIVGKTNKKGYLLVPWVPSYYEAKYEIDPLDLPISLNAPEIEKRIALKAESGYLLHFPIKQVTAATARITNQFGEDIPMGSLIIVNDRMETEDADNLTYVGWDGITYFDNLESINELTVELPNGDFCYAVIELTEENFVEDGIYDMGTVACTQK